MKTHHSLILLLLTALSISGLHAMTVTQQQYAIQRMKEDAREDKAAVSGKLSLKQQQYIAGVKQKLTSSAAYKYPSLKVQIDDYLKLLYKQLRFLNNFICLRDRYEYYYQCRENWIAHYKPARVSRMRSTVKIPNNNSSFDIQTSNGQIYHGNINSWNNNTAARTSTAITPAQIPNGPPLSYYNTKLNAIKLVFDKKKPEYEKIIAKMTKYEYWIKQFEKDLPKAQKEYEKRKDFFNLEFLNLIYATSHGYQAMVKYSQAALKSAQDPEKYIEKAKKEYFDRIRHYRNLWHSKHSADLGYTINSIARQQDGSIKILYSNKKTEILPPSLVFELIHQRANLKLTK